MARGSALALAFALCSVSGLALVPGACGGSANDNDLTLDPGPSPAGSGGAGDGSDTGGRDGAGGGDAMSMGGAAGGGPSGGGGGVGGGPGPGAGGAGASPGAAGGGGGPSIPTMPATPADAHVVINELMAANVLTFPDAAAPPAAGAAGAAEDNGWVELYNPTRTEIPLAGYALTDDLAAPRKAVLPSGLTLPPGGHLVVRLGGLAGGAGAPRVPLAPARDGGALGLARPDGSFVDRVVYGAQEVDVSAAREPDGSDRWVSGEWHVSPGAANPAGAGQPAPPEPAASAPESIPAAPSNLSDRVLGYDALPSLELLIAPADVASLLASPMTYVPATLVFEGRGYGPVGVRLKGASSFEPFDGKPSLRISVNQLKAGAAFLGLKDLTLNNMHNDFTMMHERLAYRIARDAGVPASRASHLLLTVNGAFYGLYTNVETVKKRLLPRWFADDSGSLYEATDVDFVPGDVARYELESGIGDRSLLAALAAALASSGPPEQAIADASSYVDLAAFQRYWALGSLVGHFDAFPYNRPGDDYFVYADPAGGRLEILPWGMDGCFYAATIDVTDVASGSVLAGRCRAAPACFQGYVDQAWALLGLAERLGWAAEHDRIAAQIAPFVSRDTRKPYSDADVANHQEAMRFFITGRRARFGEMLPPPSSVFR